MRNCLSSQGYLKVTSVMFNEDIQKKFGPNLGRNEYWVEVFGNPPAGSLWGWKIKGHHLTVNFTFRGDKMISHTPFLIGSNPANGALAMISEKNCYDAGNKSTPPIKIFPTL